MISRSESIATALRAPLIVSDVRFTIPSQDLIATGLLAWATCIINGQLELTGLMIRRTWNGRLTVSYPSRTDRTGQRHFYLRPIDDAARIEIEEQLLRAFRHFAEEVAR